MPANLNIIMIKSVQLVWSINLVGNLNSLSIEEYWLSTFFNHNFSLGLCQNFCDELKKENNRLKIQRLTHMKIQFSRKNLL